MTSNLLSNSFGIIRAAQVQTDNLQTQTVHITGSSSGIISTGNTVLSGPTHVVGGTQSSIAFFGNTPVQRPLIQSLNTSTGTPSVYDIAVKVNEILNALNQMGLIRTQQ